MMCMPYRPKNRRSDPYGLVWYCHDYIGRNITCIKKITGGKATSKQLAVFVSRLFVVYNMYKVWDQPPYARATPAVKKCISSTWPPLFHVFRPKILLTSRKWPHTSTLSEPFYFLTSKFSRVLYWPGSGYISCMWFLCADIPTSFSP